MSFSDEGGLTIETGNREIAFNHRNYSDTDLTPIWEPRELPLIGSSSEGAVLKQSQREEYED